MSKYDPLGELFKRYESKALPVLETHTPVIIRIDGRAFHTITKKLKCKKPFDRPLHQGMIDIAKAVCNDAQNARMAYTQSDEVSVLLYEKNPESQAWFGNRLQKIVSIAASLATYHFGLSHDVPAYFDARAFNLPPELVQKYFYWRFKDARRNSVSMLAQSLFPHKKLHGKNGGEMIRMCREAGVEYQELESWKRVGSLIVKEYTQHNLPDGGMCHRLSWVDRTAEFENEDAANTFYEEMLKREESVPVF